MDQFGQLVPRAGWILGVLARNILEGVKAVSDWWLARCVTLGGRKVVTYMFGSLRFEAANL